MVQGGGWVSLVVGRPLGSESWPEGLRSGVGSRSSVVSRDCDGKVWMKGYTRRYPLMCPPRQDSWGTRSNRSIGTVEPK